MWIIQDKVFGEEQKLLVKALFENAIFYKTVDDSINIKSKHVRGSVEFVQQHQSENMLTLENYTYSKYSKYFKNDLLNYPFIILPWWALYNYWSMLFDTFKTDRLFIRPNSGSKIFTGTTFSKKWYFEELNIIKNLPNSYITQHDLIVVAPAKEIEAECRVLLHKNKIIDYDYYVGELQRGDIKNIEKLVKSIQYYPDNLYVVDIAFYEDQAKIIEINNGFSAGWYNMDYDKIVKYISNV